MNNNPVAYSDPTGHKPFIEDDKYGNPMVEADWHLDRTPRKNTKPPSGDNGDDGDWWNPFKYDTAAFGVKGLLKEIIGFDADIAFYWNMKALRSWDFENLDASFNIDVGGSLGLSGEGAGGVGGHTPAYTPNFGPLLNVTLSS